MRVVQKLAAVVAGAILALVAWLVLVPWDLSEISPDGQALDQGADDHAPAIALVAGVVTVVAVSLLSDARIRRSAAVFAAGGLATWAVLFAWRASASRVSGANMFVIPLVGAVIPLAAAVPLALGAATSRLSRRDASRAT